MKCVFVVLGFVLLSGIVSAQSITLDEAIKNAAAEMSGKLPKGSTIAVINFRSSSTRFTDYVIDELNDALVNAGGLKPIERRRLDSLQTELKFNMSGDVSDDSAQRIGRMLGARNMVLGSIDVTGSIYRVRFQAVSVESATLQFSYTADVKSNDTMESLMRGGLLADFSPEQRAGAVALNLAFGMGSFFIEKDISGGTVTAVFEGIGLVAIIVASALYNADYPDRGSSYYEEAGTSRRAIGRTYYAYPLYIGIAAYVGGAVFGIVRAITYHKPASTLASKKPDGFDGFNVEITPTSHNTVGLKLAYTMRY
ncbi:MAG: CsgG/HfaB family protein [Spirochaetaceae bacterium]|jgi:TolB-like protein|nr:CsgG/HfaB family protein [Spirochaetaceae bacterium]